MEDSADVRVLRPKRLHANIESALVEGLGLGIAAQGQVNPGETVERRGYPRVLRPQRLFADSKVLLGEGKCFAVPASPIKTGRFGVRIWNRLRYGCACRCDRKHQNQLASPTHPLTEHECPQSKKNSCHDGMRQRQAQDVGYV